MVMIVHLPGCVIYCRVWGLLYPSRHFNQCVGRMTTGLGKTNLNVLLN